MEHFKTLKIFCVQKIFEVQNLNFDLKKVHLKSFIQKNYIFQDYLFLWSVICNRRNMQKVKLYFLSLIFLKKVQNFEEEEEE